ncbi:alpha/beta fold hydrolase [Paenibacillus aestuarii]|uniref:Alpha/beta fold hydrolase n=1 Tax=Paenibacillus aestuarii TaxID=516965 RepID=A0ABW0KFK5_9BACL|nr:alpha/beta fold hydrolase [Paenibacillus aestuarii]
MKRPFELDPGEYPFTDHWLPYRDGHIHYLDEGQGPTVLLLHGNPTWSYLYRNVIKELCREFRLIAPDYPGFGMSKAPEGYRFTPQEQSEAVHELIRHLDLKDFILVVQDWGGPIGLNYAVQHRDNLRGIVVMNTWAWPAKILPMKLFSLAMGGPIGYWLQTRLNFFAKTIVPNGIHHTEKVTDSLRKAYTDPFPTPKSRIPTWVFPGQIRKARAWLAAIESKLSNLSDLPAQILWGTKDSAGFPLEQMAKWQKHLPMNETIVLEDASHYLQEDRPDQVASAIRKILNRTQGGVLL